MKPVPRAKPHAFPTPLHGTTIEDYEILGRLGKGSHSVVHEVKCLKCGSKHALKIVSKQKLKEKNLTPLLVNEMKLHNSLKHERIVKLLQCFEDSECIYLLTELCKGGELNSLVKSKRKISTEELKRMFRQIVEGVKYLHDNRIIHRDLKLANIMLTESQNIKIGDFGLAVQLKDYSEERETMCGTPNYMSPEILVNHPYSFEADVWSLGCILYALLIGRPPFEGPGAQDTMLNVKKGKYELPSGLCMEAKDLIRKLLKYNREERINVGDILLHPFLADELVYSPQEEEEKMPIPTPEKPPKPILLETKANEENRGYKANAVSEQPRNKKLKTPITILRNLNTERLKPITHTTSQGYIKIDKSGIVELEIASRGKFMRISPNGQRITIGSKIIENCAAEFNLSTLPPHYATMYKYAYDFVNILRSKTPKVVIKGEGFKCCLMENEPSHNMEFYKKDGTKIYYQISGGMMDILLPDKKRLQVNPYKEGLPTTIKLLVKECFGMVKRCEEIERQAEMEGKKFPIVVTEGGNSKHK